MSPAVTSRFVASRRSRSCSATPTPCGSSSTASPTRSRGEAAKAISRASPSTSPRNDVVMADLIQPVKGMNDVLADQAPWWAKVESVAYDLFARYGYRRVYLPVLERTELFSRSIGELT